MRLYSPRLATWLPLASVLMGIASLFYLTQTSEVATTGYSIQELQVEENNWNMRNEQLALDVAKARSLASVQAEATKRLGMIPAKNVVYLKAPSADASRPALASRGEARPVPDLEKTGVTPSRSLLDTMGASISDVFDPRSWRKP